MYQFDSRIRYSEVDKECNLTLTAMMNYFQDCSVAHSESLDRGVRYLSENHMAWVLSSWQICCDNMPRLFDEVTVSTWAYDMKAFYGYRNFTMDRKNGERLAYANSVWVLVDTLTGRPVKVPEDIINEYGTSPQLEMECSSRKIKVPADMEAGAEMVVPKFFIDSNQHMNNEKYVAIAQELLPAEFKIKELRVEYKKEAKLGDTIGSSVKKTDEGIVAVLADTEDKPYAVVQFIGN